MAQDPVKGLTPDEFTKRFGSLEHLKPTSTTPTQEEQQGLTPEEFKKKFKTVSPEQVSSDKPPSEPAEDSIFDLEIGKSLGIGGKSALATLARIPQLIGLGLPSISVVPTVPSGKELEEISASLQYLVNKITTPKKEKPLPPAKSLKEVFTSPRRIAEGAIEALPLMGIQIGAFVANPLFGTALMVATEGSEPLKEIDEWEKQTGNVLPREVKAMIGGTVGGINGLLEKLGIGFMLKRIGGKGLLRKFTQALITAPVEGGTEFLQEWTQILAGAGYKDAEGVLTNMWKAVKDPQNLVRSAEAGAVGAVLGPSVAGGLSTLEAVARSDEATPPAKKPPLPPPPSEEEVTKARLETLEKEGKFPKLETTDDALAYGVLNIKDEDVLAWKQKIREMQNEIDTARGQNVNPLFRIKNVYEIGETILRYAPQGEMVESKVTGISTVEKTIDASIRNAEKLGNKPVVEILSKLREVLPLGAQVVLVDDLKGSFGTFELGTNNIVFSRESFTRYEGGKEKTSDKILGTVAHELLHFGTVAPFRANPENLSSSEAKFVKTIEELRRLAESNRDQEFGTSLGLSSEIEFITHGLTNPDFQAFLKTIHLGGPKEKTMWQTLLDAIAEFFGVVGQNTALEKLVNATGEYLSTRKTGIDIEQALTLQKYKEALGAKLDAKIQYDPVKGFTQTPLTDSDYEMIVRSISGQDANTRLQWAKEQTDKSLWLKHLAGKGPAPVEYDVNPGADIIGQVLGDDPLPEGTTDEDLEIEYKKPDHIWKILQLLKFPEFALRRKEKARKDATAVLEGEQYLNTMMRDYEAWYNKLNYKMSKEERKETRRAMERAYVAQDPNAQTVSILSAKQDLEEIYAKNPRMKRVIEGADSKGGIIHLFEFVKDRYQKKEIQRLRLSLSEVDNVILDKLLVEGVDMEAIAKAEVEDKYDIEGISKREFNERQLARFGTEDAWTNTKERKRKVKRDAVVRRESKRLVREVEKIKNIKNWGLKEYITNIELGSYRILDVRGGERKTIGFGRTAKEAKKKAFAMRKERNEQGELIRRTDFEVEASTSPIKPHVKRKDVFEGEDDIFEILPRYIYAMEKRIIMQPIIDQYRKNVKADPKEYTADVKVIIQEQINYVMGAKYSLGDVITDDVMKHFGWETGAYSRGIGKARKWWARFKLGYRPTAAVVNAMGGFGNTWVGVGQQFFLKGKEVWKSGKYVDPNTGEVIDFDKKLEEVRSKGGLGIDLAVGEGGEIQTRIPLWQPLGLFQLPERFIRPHGFAANYVYQREVMGLDDQAATEAAKINLRLQNFAYNLAAIPHILRSPSGRLIGQFKTYLIGQIQFLSTLRGRQIYRMIGLQLMMAGPRGVVYMLKSLPWIGAIGLLDDLEEWLVKEKGIIGDVLTRGIGGAFGVDISAPATFQLPSRPEELAGPFLGDALELYKKVILPTLQLGMAKVSGSEEPAYILDEAINWVASLSPLMTYWKDLDKSIMVWDEVMAGKFAKAYKNLKENYRKPNVWITDSENNRAYQIGGLWDRTMLLLGAPPTSKTQYQVLKSIWIKNTAIRSDNRHKAWRRISRKLLRGIPIGNDEWQDAILYGLDPKQIPTVLEFKLMTPLAREVKRAELFRKAEAIDHFGLER
ncbi:hypothetical protein LCGC14_0395210 [marine sediment metagenome]|uniref:Large polyvalent protein associated domain-containing protein n=1 Tax=marine sediment metagenome TaxID=412755 RepID=A0A0F9VKC3_9ZZZZ